MEALYVEKFPQSEASERKEVGRRVWLGRQLWVGGEVGVVSLPANSAGAARRHSVVDAEVNRPARQGPRRLMHVESIWPGRRSDESTSNALQPMNMPVHVLPVLHELLPDRDSTVQDPAFAIISSAQTFTNFHQKHLPSPLHTLISCPSYYAYFSSPRSWPSVSTPSAMP